ncbi:hypothetical protein FACS1894167_06990 [Synergistales bacterium]|nr:hypothetical protein FACS1894167_06990 [Synergistales bacterium]
MKRGVPWLFRRSAAALFFCVLSVGTVWADSADIYPSGIDYGNTLSGYLMRILIAFALLGGAGYAAAKFLPKRFGWKGGGKLRVIGALSLGRDMVYVIRVGPEVIAVFSGKSSTEVIGQWSFDEWDALSEGRDSE